MVRILILHDDAGTSGPLVATLTGGGFEVVVATHDQAPDCLKEDDYNVIFFVPGALLLSGWQVLDAVRRALCGHRVPIVVAADHHWEAFYHDAKMHGAVGCVQKPFEPKSLLKLVAACDRMEL